MAVERGEAIDIHRLRNECMARWKTSKGATYLAKQIRVGVLEDGRWFVAYSAQLGGQCRAYATKRQAWQIVQQLMRTADDWTRIPCYDSHPPTWRSAVPDPEP